MPRSLLKCFGAKLLYQYRPFPGLVFLLDAAVSHRCTCCIIVSTTTIIAGPVIIAFIIIHIFIPLFLFLWSFPLLILWYHVFPADSRINIKGKCKLSYTSRFFCCLCYIVCICTCRRHYCCGCHNRCNTCRKSLECVLHIYSSIVSLFGVIPFRHIYTTTEKRRIQYPVLSDNVAFATFRAHNVV